MTRAEFRAVLAPLVLTMRVDFDAPTWTAYYRALEDVPLGMLQTAAERASREDRQFMPKPGELRAMAERRRQELIAAHPYERCADCNFVGIVRTGTKADGRTPIYGKCQCWASYLKRLDALGISNEPLALPAATEQVDA